MSGTIKGNQVTLSVTGSAEGQEFKMDYVGTVEGDAMAGKVVFGGFGEGTFKGTRARPPQSQEQGRDSSRAPIEAP